MTYQLKSHFGEIVITSTVYKSCLVQINNLTLPIDLISLKMHKFDVILGIDWLTTHHAKIDYFHKIISFHIHNQPVMQIQATKPLKSITVISSHKAIRLLKNGCQAFLAHVTDLNKNTSNLNDILIVNEFLTFFLRNFLAYPQTEKLNSVSILNPILNPFPKLNTKWLP